MLIPKCYGQYIFIAKHLSLERKPGYTPKSNVFVGCRRYISVVIKFKFEICQKSFGCILLSIALSLGELASLPHKASGKHGKDHLRKAGQLWYLG